MRSFLIALLLGLPLAGCPSVEFEDVDGDGIRDDEDDDLDNDGLTNEQEADLGTDPYEADSDGDGASDEEELELGIDPLAADSDGDGQDDGQEIDNGTNPANEFHRDYIGGYELTWFDLDDLPEATGPSGRQGFGPSARDVYVNGDVPENFSLIDQYGEEVHLYSFFGRHVMIAIGAEWCGPCNQLASTAQAEQDHYGPEGFTLLEVCTQDSQGAPAGPDVAERWANTHGLTTVPSLAGGEFDPENTMEADGYIPTVLHIGADGAILSMDEGRNDPGFYF